jgi:hypothetical protein
VPNEKNAPGHNRQADDRIEVAEPGSTASGITQCLRMLAEEANDIGLRQTALALCDVIELCRAEVSMPGRLSQSPPAVEAGPAPDAKETAEADSGVVGWRTLATALLH